MRALVLIGCLIIGLAQPVPKQANKPAANHSDDKPIPRQLAKPAIESGLPSKGISPQEKQYGTDSQPQESHWCQRVLHWLHVIFAPLGTNWPLIAVAIWGILVARGTLKTIERQTKATEDNVKALIASERGWLLMGKIEEPFLEPIEKMGVNQRASHCIFYLKNAGKTPVRMVAGRVELQISERPTHPPNNRVYEAKSEIPRDVLAPGEPIPAEARFSDNIFISTEDSEAIESKSKFLWLCGIFWYRDTLQGEDAEPHETRFSWLYETRLNSPKPFWKPWPLRREYNECT